MRSERFNFPNARGKNLTAVLDLPLGEPTAYALFAHCFTRGKDNAAAQRITERLSMYGIAVLRFDFTGLGSSEAEFANTHFTFNVDDLAAAADHLRKTRAAPAILIGHSLGGCAVLVASHKIPEARVVVTIGAPYDPRHLIRLFNDDVRSIRAQGEVKVSLAGQPLRIKREFIDDVAEQRLNKCLANLRKALLVFHSPTDQTVGIENASHIFAAAKHPKSFVSLSGADHLLSKKIDAIYVANVIAAWAERYLDLTQTVATAESRVHAVIVRESGAGKFQQEIMSGPHRFLADEPIEFGGLDSGPSPYDLLLASLGTCTSMTVWIYARHKQLPLTHVSVRLAHKKIHAMDCENCETNEGMVDYIERAISFEGDLNAEQRQRLLEIADKCPVHRTLKSEIDIRTFEKRN